MNSRFLLVPEKTIIEASNEMIDEPDNAFKRALKDAQIYRNANLTPIFLLDQKNMILSTSAEEIWGKKLH